VYDASTEQFITTLAKEVVHLSETFHRPEIKVLDAVHKAITAVESAILQNMADEEDRLALN
jgi:hypothetical protein